MDNIKTSSFFCMMENYIRELKGKRLADVFRFISFIPGETYGPHGHLRVEINYVKKGSCLLHLEEKTFTFREGELMFITPNVRHKFEAGSKGVQLMQLEFLPEIFSRFALAMETDESNGVPFTSFLFSGHHQLIKIVDDLRIVRVIQEIIHELQVQSVYYDYQVVLLYIELQILIYRYVKKSILAECTNETLRKATDYISQNYSTNISVDEVALHVGVSSRYLRTLFSRNLHLSPIDYLNLYRVNKAVELLKQTGLSVKEVSFQCGFRSPQYFSRIFKRYMGVTPCRMENENSSV